jgi:ABC-type transporter Mla subunit MlaD
MDEMAKAVEDVNSVAEELRMLRDKVKQYGDASERLREMCDALKELCGSVEKIQTAFSAALDDARQLQSDAQKLVQRIELSDIGASTKELSVQLNGMTTKLESDKAIQNKNTHIISDVATTVKELSARLDNMSARLETIQGENTQAVSEMKNIVTTKNDQATDAAIDNFRKIYGQIIPLRADATKQHEALNNIENILQEILNTVRQESQKKKGFFGN